MTGKDILELKMDVNDAHAGTIRGYLVALLTALWMKQEGFSGKRPFGNSGWFYDLYIPLIKAGVCTGSLDDAGYIYEVNDKQADELIALAIEALA